MARFLSVAVLALLMAGAFAQRVSPSPKPSSPSPSPEVSPSPAVKPSPATAAKAAAPEPAEEAVAPTNKLTPAANEAITDAIARAKPTLRGRDAQRVLDNMQGPLEKVAEAKAAGVPVQIAVARSVTDVQQKVPLNPQSRQAVLDAAYRVYTSSPATLATTPSPSPEPVANVTAPLNATDATNATLPGDMDAVNGTEPMDAMNTTMTEEPMGEEAMNATMPGMDGMNATEPAADNATRGGAGAGAAGAPTAPKPLAPKSSGSLAFVSTGALAMLAAAVVALL